MGRFAAAVLLLATLLVLAVAEGRYLPTRGDSDRLDRLRELIKELLESDLEKLAGSAGQPEAPFAASADPEPGRPEPARPEPLRPEPGRPDPYKPARPEMYKAVRPDLYKPARQEMYKPDRMILFKRPLPLPTRTLAMAEDIEKK